jgi:hypothetical protein
MNIFSHCLERLLLHETSRQAKKRTKEEVFPSSFIDFFQFPAEKKSLSAAAAIINSLKTHESDKTAEKKGRKRVNGVWV